MKNRNGGKTIIIVLIILLLILALVGTGAYIYLATDLFKTPEQLFKKYMLSNVIELVQTEIKPFDEIDTRSETELAEYNFKVDVNAEELGNEDIKNLDVNLTLKTDWPNKNEEMEILVNKNEEEFFKAYFALTNETFGIKIPDIYDKFLAVENRDFKKIAKTFELSEEYIEQIPDKIPSGLTPEEEEKLTALSTKYVTKIVEHFGEDAYIAEKNINVTLNSQEIVTNRYTLSMTTKNLYTLLTNTVTELLEDPEFVELTKDRITTEQLDEIKTTYKDFLAENSVEDIEDQTIKISVYAADGRTVKTEMKADTGEEINFFIINNEEETIITASEITPKDEFNDIAFTTTTTIKNTYKDEVGELRYETVVSYNKDDIAAAQAEYDAEYADYGSGFEKNYSEIYADEKTGFIITTKKSNGDTYVGTIELDGEEVEEIKDILDLSFKCQFGKASVTTISTKNAVIINDYTMEDYQELVTEMGTNLLSVAMLKPNSLIGTIFTTITQGNSTTDEDLNYSDENPFYQDDYSNDYGNYDDITISDDSYNDDYLYPSEVAETETLREDFDWDVTFALEMCLSNYKDEITFNNPEANLGDFLNIDKVQEYCGDEYVLELPDSTTIKCTMNQEGVEYIFYALMDIDGESLSVREVEVLTEEEYLNR